MTARACRVCGCIDAEACPGGCHWIEDDLCSSCVGSVLATAVLSWSLPFRDPKDGVGPAEVWEAQLHDRNGRLMFVWFNEEQRQIIVCDHLGVEIGNFSAERNYIAAHYTEAELIETFKSAKESRDIARIGAQEAA